jgi:hypothetical protein
MSLNSLTYPLQYEDLRLKADPEITLDIEPSDEPASAETGFEGIIGKSLGLRRVLEMVETSPGEIRRCSCWARPARAKS